MKFNPTMVIKDTGNKVVPAQPGRIGSTGRGDRGRHSGNDRPFRKQQMDDAG